METAIWQTEEIWPKIIEAHFDELEAAPIPQPTQPLGAEAQQTGPTPE